jgi:hypothetical protein
MQRVFIFLRVPWWTFVVKLFFVPFVVPVLLRGSSLHAICTFFDFSAMRTASRTIWLL